MVEGSAGPTVEIGARSSRRGFSRLLSERLAVRFAIVAGAAALTIPSVIWIALDRSVWPWDPAWYGEVSVDLWAAARGDGVSWPGAMLSAFGLKPPGIAWIGQFSLPLRHVIGSENAMLLSIVATQIVALVLLAVAARRLTGSKLAAATAIVGLASAPLFLQLGHEYFPESLQTLTVAWVLLIMASARMWRLSLTLTQLGAALALGLLAKLTTPLYEGLPMLAALVLAITAPGRELPPWWRDRRVQLSSILMLALGVGTVGWYSRNLAAAIAHARDAQSSTLYGVTAGPLERLQSWSQEIRDASFLPWIGTALLVLIALGAIVRLARAGRGGRLRGAANRRPWLTPRFVGLAATAATIVAVLASFTTARPQDPRYLLAVVPSVVLAATLVLAWIGVREIALAALVLFAFQYVVATGQELGAFRASRMAYVGLQRPVTGRFSDALRTIVRQTCNAQSAGRINMVGVDYPWLNANVLEMYAAEEFRFSGRACYYTPLGYAEQNPAKAWQRLRDFKPPYFIALDYTNPANQLPTAQAETINPKDAFNAVDRAVFQRVRRSHLFAVVPGTEHSGLILLRAVP
jgi:Dolichyl-phosphate-mannose-protein mannosyltransferase